MWFITFSTKHPICKTFLRLNQCFIKTKTKTLQICLGKFCDHSRLLFIVLYFQAININPFDTSVLVCPSTAKISKKTFSQIFMKSSTQPNFDMENSKIELIFPNFSFSSLFLPRLVKNVFKNGSKIFFSAFRENCHTTSFWFREFKKPN